MRSFIFSCSMLLCFHMQAVTAVDLYVSPMGSEGADGSRGKPFTLEEARLAARSFLGRAELCIWLMDGIYYLDEALVFSLEDGGTLEYPVYYRSMNEGKAIVGCRSNVRP